jgi:hypothetical protein
MAAGSGEWASAPADQELARLHETQLAEHLSAQAILDEQWSLLCANDPTPEAETAALGCAARE